MRRAGAASGRQTMAALAGMVASAALALGPAQAAVFGADDRVAPPPQLKRQQEALGVLFNIRSRSVCTAFCVGDQMIVTAAHCLFKTRGEPTPRLEDFWFARNYDEIRDYARIAGHTTRAAAQNVVAGSTGLSVAPPIDATSDWAIVRLSKPVCMKHSLDVEALPASEIHVAANKGQISQLAYHRDFKLWRQAWSRPCPVARDYENAPWSSISADFSNPDALLLHTCDTGGASSGSPLLLDTASGPKVIGINVGTYVQSRVIMSGGQTVQRMKPETVANTGVSATAFHDALTVFRGATILMTTAAIRDLQTTLAKAGFYKGPVDGIYGAPLRTAIIAFEVSERLPATGIASEAILLKAREAAKR